MFLYHGTSEAIAEIVRKRGLLPRSRHNGKHNWGHVFAGNRDAVYLTDAYPVTYAVEAVENGKRTQRLAIIEVDSASLDPSKLAPDEDVLEQIGRKQDDLPSDWPMKRRGAYYRSRIGQHAELWEKSLKLLGTCAYLDAIPVSALTRIALVDFTQARQAVWIAIDASVTLQNYRLVGLQHKAITNWFFGDPPPKYENEMQRFLNEDHLAAIAAIPRNGVEIINLKS